MGGQNCSNLSVTTSSSIQPTATKSTNEPETASSITSGNHTKNTTSISAETNLADSKVADSSHSGLSRSQLAGVIVAAIAGAFLLALLTFLLFGRRRNRERYEDEKGGETCSIPATTQPTSRDGYHQVVSESGSPELDGTNSNVQASELDPTTRKSQPSELNGVGTKTRTYELES
jgi:hypothetical protein